MKQIKTLALLCAASLLFACNKSDNSNPGGGGNNQPKSGKISILNTKKSPYRVERNGTNIGILQPSDELQMTLPPGDYYFKMTQQSGYVLYPSVYEISATLYAGNELEYYF